MNVKLSRISACRAPKSFPIRIAALFLVGGLGYYAMELAFRGRSHWSMALCGGICLCAVYHMNRALQEKPLIVRAGIGSLIITAVELLCGCLVNLVLQWNVWDYSRLPWNLWGQICLPFSLLWLALCFPVCTVCSFVEGER